MAPWPSGKAKVCNTSIPGPIPGGASKKRWVPNRVPIFFCIVIPLLDTALRIYAQNPVRKFGERTFRARTGTPRRI